MVNKSIRYFISCFASMLSFSAVAQVVVDSPEYQQMKASGTLSGMEILQDPTLQNPVFPEENINSLHQFKSSSCNCYIEPDASYTLALAPNDDGSSALIPIPFSFCLYGQTYNSIYINNNGNVTFTSPMATFSATAFPSVGDGIVAPFWGDVDTRNGLGQVLYKITPTAVYINWVDVGYYAIHGDLRNTFQLTITDGADPIIESGNVAFCYKDMQWTTGDASSGQGGFGGIPATAGANKGDGLAYFLISRFDHAGNDFDGALGNPDGISWLDYKSFAFDACNTSNIPPIPDGISSCDTFKICALGDTADFSINFLSPEVGQSTSITWTNGGLTSLQEINNVSGNTAQLVLRAIGNLADIGTYTVTVTATDDFSPTPGVTTMSFVVMIDTVGANLNPQLTPLAGCDTVALSVLNGPFDTYLWDDLGVQPTNGVGSAQLYGVTVSLNGCYKRVEEYIHVMEPFDINLQGNFVICAPNTTTTITVPNAAYYDTISWGLADPVQNNAFSNNLGAGTYTIHLEDSLRQCSNDTTFTIQAIPAPQIFPDTMACYQNFNVQGTTAYNGGVWSATDTTVHFTDPNILNPSIYVTVPGTYTVSFTDNACGITLTSEIYYPGGIYTQVLDTNVCEGTSYDIWAMEDPDILNYVWSTGETGRTINVSNPGDYIVVATNECYTVTDTATIGIKICDITVPNIITLSSQNGNNLFFVEHTGVVKFECSIVNRWGNKIYEYSDPQGSWNGRTENGDIVDEGTYFYLIKAVLENGDELNKQGFVQVYH